MPPSQLKRLKSSLREQGITGAQKSKKSKKTAASKDPRARVQKHAALRAIRDAFNPFDLQAPARPPKFSSLSLKSAGDGRYKQALHRPGVARSVGEEARRATLLPELRGRNRVGGLVDRRIGEGDAAMAPEEKAGLRFAREKLRARGGVFDLEGDGLTHLGRPLGIDDDREDFAEVLSDGEGEGEESGSDGELMKLKRRRADDGEGDGDGGQAALDVDGQSERKKTKNEVMQEVMAKSKLYKYERQKAKEDDDDLREQLDDGMQEMLALLQGHRAPAKSTAAESSMQARANGDVPAMNPDRQALLDGMDRGKADKEYELRLRQLAQDTRAAPAERSKTAEEKAVAEAERLEALEKNRLRRMRGEEVSDDEDEVLERRAAGGDEDVIDDDEEAPDEAAEFGFASSNTKPSKEKHVVLEDEDEFVMDEDLLADSSDKADNSAAESNEASDAADRDEDEEDEFVRGIFGHHPATAVLAPPTSTSLPYTYPCPRSHAELLAVLAPIPPHSIPTVVQRIRAQHHPSLSAGNSAALSDFAAALVEHLAHMADAGQPLPLIATLARHAHSLSRAHPQSVANAFRRRLQLFHARSGPPTAGDMVILTAIGAVYPTADHFHHVTTPAMTLIARWLGLTAPRDEKALATGAFLVALSVDFQARSRRYVPEAVRFTLKALASPLLAAEGLRRAHVENAVAMAELWAGASAFAHIFTPFAALLGAHGEGVALQRIALLLACARKGLRPLALHHHRPLAVRSSVPKFEPEFHPERHYDADRPRAEARKLVREVGRERKGAVRELRKDARFVARTMLGEKRERDAAYERGQRRLLAEIREEGGRRGGGVGKGGRGGRGRGG